MSLELGLRIGLGQSFNQGLRLNHNLGTGSSLKDIGVF